MNLPKRGEIRILFMTENEYERAMRQFLDNYEEEKGFYYDCSTNDPDFNSHLDGMMEIANTDELGTQYAAWITDGSMSFSGSNKPINLRELPESFDPEKFEFDNCELNLDYEGEELE